MQPMKKIGAVALWTLLILAGSASGMAVVATLTGDREMADVSSDDASDDWGASLQSSTAVTATMTPEISGKTLPLPQAGGKNTYPLSAVTVQPISTECGVQRVLEWARPGSGAYCLVKLALLGQGRDATILNAEDQALYPPSDADVGYRASFFIGEDGVPVRSVAIGPTDRLQLFVVADAPADFTPSRMLIQESAIDTSASDSATERHTSSSPSHRYETGESRRDGGIWWAREAALFAAAAAERSILDGLGSATNAASLAQSRRKLNPTTGKLV